MKKPKKELFTGIVGQPAAKQKLGFFLESYEESRIVPPLFFVAPKGCGKTTLAKAFARHCTRIDEPEKPKTFLEVNCSILRNIKQFFDQIVVPNIVDKEVTILFDEASKLPMDVSMALLTILNPNENDCNTFSIGDATFDFDLRKITWLFATTDPQKVLEALRDRLERIDLEEYGPEDLAKVVAKNLKDFEYDEELLLEVAKDLRGNPRAAQKFGGHVRKFLIARKKSKFTEADWKVIRKILAIHPLGLSPIEIQILTALKLNGESSLTKLSSIVGMTRDSLQKDGEIHLLKHSLLSIEQRGRMITTKGLNYLKELEKKMS